MESSNKSQGSAVPRNTYIHSLFTVAASLALPPRSHTPPPSPARPILSSRRSRSVLGYAVQFPPSPPSSPFPLIYSFVSPESPTFPCLPHLFPNLQYSSSHLAASPTDGVHCRSPRHITTPQPTPHTSHPSTHHATPLVRSSA